MFAWHPNLLNVQTTISDIYFPFIFVIDEMAKQTNKI